MLKISNRFLFRFRVPCRKTEQSWSQTDGITLDASYSLPDFSSLDSTLSGNEGTKQLTARKPFDLRIAWNPKGLFFSLNVYGKNQLPWCRGMHPEESDGLQICLDTRNVKDVHRATRFCHRLVFLPTQGSNLNSGPLVVWLPIHRAKDHPSPINLKSIRLLSRFKSKDYRLDAFLPAETLTGYNPQEHPALGFHFVFSDRELGNQYFLVQPPLPHDQDPSLWGTLELIS